METKQSAGQPAAPQRYPSVLVWAVRIALPLLLLFAGVKVRQYQLSTAPQPGRRPPGERSILVDVQPLTLGSQPIRVIASGTVTPARDLVLRSRVSGHVASVYADFTPGALLQAEQVVVQLEPTDFDLAIARAQVSLQQSLSRLEQVRAQQVQAEYAHKLELGRQDVARHEWLLLRAEVDLTELEEELMLRKPHLRKAEADQAAATAAVAAANADVEAARLALTQAELNRQRTAVRVPFPAVVRSRSVTEGSEITSQTVLGTLAAVDEFWIEVAVAVEALRWIAFPDKESTGAEVWITPSGNADRAAGKVPGRIVKLLPDLEPQGRMARILVAVAEPLQTQPPVLLGAFVNVEFSGRDLDDVFILPRHTVHEGNIVWLIDASNRLQFRTVTLVWSDAEVAVVRDNLQVGEKLVLTNITAATPGMQLLTPDGGGNGERGNGERGSGAAAGKLSAADAAAPPTAGVTADTDDRNRRP